MPFFSKPTYSTISPVKKKDIPKDLYTRCPKSGELVYTKELEKNLMVVPISGYHFPLIAPKRIESMVDEGSWEEFDIDLESIDLLEFKDTKAYADRLITYKKKTGLKEAVICGLGSMGGIPVSYLREMMSQRWCWRNWTHHQLNRNCRAQAWAWFTSSRPGAFTAATASITWTNWLPTATLHGRERWPLITKT